MTDAKIRVALVDDQALFRAGVRMLLESQADLEFVGEAADGLDGVLLAREHRPDVILMDLRMPVLDGLEATKRIVAEAGPVDAGWGGPRVLVLTTFDLDENAARAIRAGASGFVLKDAAPEFLLAAIRSVHAGNAVIAATQTAELFARFTPQAAVAPPPPRYAELTPREQEIFRHAAAGLSNSEIAAAEFLSEATVKTHVSRVLHKLALRDRVQLVVFAHEHGLAAPQGGTTG